MPPIRLTFASLCRYRTPLPGIFFLLTLQATAALTRRPHHGGRGARHRWMLLGYVWITFVLATIGFAGNARYTEMIWIDLRDAPGGPAALILDEMNYWINMMALTWYVLGVFTGRYVCSRTSHGIVTTSWNGSCKPCWFALNPFISYIPRSHHCLAALPLFCPLGLAETCRHTHDYNLCSHGRYVSIPIPRFRYIKTNTIRHSHVHSCPRRG